MTSTRSDGFNTLLFVFVPVQLMSVYGALTARMEYSLLFLLNIFVVVAHLHYGVCVVSDANHVPTGAHLLFLFPFEVRQICDHLNIFAFKITDRSKQPPPPAEVHIKH